MLFLPYARIRSHSDSTMINEVTKQRIMCDLVLHVPRTNSTATRTENDNLDFEMSTLGICALD